MKKYMLFDDRTGSFAKPYGVFLTLMVLVLSLVSCSDDDYLNAIPANSIAVVSVDAAGLAASGVGDKADVSALKGLLKADNIEHCGIDWTSKIYLFESAEGNLGLVARVSDDGDLASWLDNMAGNGFCTKTFKRGKCRFSTVKDSWVAGFSSSAVVMMGPVVPSQQAAVRQQITRYLGQDEDYGIKNSPLFARLDSINDPVAMVAQAAALPEQLAASFTLGAPKDADASQILIAAGLKTGGNGCIEIEGATFSLNKDIDKAIRQSMQTFRSITRKYIGSMSADAVLGAFMNVNGVQFLDILRSNKQFQALLAGINTAIDMDNIIKNIDGDVAIVIPQQADNGTSVQLGAQLGGKNFLSDVDYWKKSCPNGGRIADWDKDAYFYTDGTMSYYFGVTADLQYYSGSTADIARQSIGMASKPLPQAVRSLIEGKRLCMVLNIEALLGGSDGSKALLPLLKPILGGVSTVVYSVK